MTDLITKEDAYAQLRLDADSSGSPDDPWLNIWIPAISQAVRTWLKDSWRPYVLEVDSSFALVVDSSGNPVPVVDSNGNPMVHPLARAACLIELARLYTNRAASGADQTDVPVEFGNGYILGRGATGLLTGLRKSTVA